MIRLSSRAERWLLDHIAHLADESPSAARKLLADFRLLRLNLTAFPHMAPRGVIPGTRRAVLGSLILTILERDGVIEIAAIRHAKQEDAYAPSDLADEIGYLAAPMRDDPEVEKD